MTAAAKPPTSPPGDIPTVDELVREWLASTGRPRWLAPVVLLVIGRAWTSNLVRSVWGNAPPPDREHLGPRSACPRHRSKIHYR